MSNAFNQLRDLVNTMAAEGLQLDAKGLQTLKEKYDEYAQSDDYNPIVIIQYLFNEGSKAGAQSILQDYYSDIVTPKDLKRKELYHNKDEQKRED